MRCLAIAALLVAGAAWGHDSSWTQEQFDWVQRRYARNGMHCCGPDDFHMIDGDRLDWRTGPRGYEVRIMGRWYPVRPDQIMAPHPGDPSPFGSGPMLFFRWGPDGVPVIYCLRPGVML